MSLVASAWCALAAASLLIGALITRWLGPSPRIIAAVMAVGSGVLIGAVSYDLVDDARQGTPMAWLLGAIIVGACSFVAGSRVISGAQRRKHPVRAGGEADDSSSLSMVLGSVLDGIPESVVLGLTVLSGSVSPGLLAGVALSNLPEGMASSSGLLRSGWSFTRVARMWIVVVVVSAIAGGLGPALLASAPPAAAGIAQAFAAGALLAMIVDTMIPEAYDVDRDWTGLLVVLGFVATVAIGSL